MCDQQPHRLAGVRLAQPDVSQLTQVAQGDVAGLADAVGADPEVGVAAGLPSGRGLTLRTSTQVTA
jgi:hypothetical protein